jgi:hypothetical protein
MPNIFSRHPATVGETYTEHFRFATRFGLRMITGGLACCVHGVLPFVFETTGSRTVRALHARVATGRGMPQARPSPAALIEYCI